MAKTEQLYLQRMENNSRETQEKADRKCEFHSDIEKSSNFPKRDEMSTSNSNNQQPPERDQGLEMQQRRGIETMSSDSDQTIAVKAISFKRYLGATIVKYIQLETASRVQYNEKTVPGRDSDSSGTKSFYRLANNRR